MIFTAKCWWLLRTQEQSAYYQLYHPSLCLFARALVTVQFIRITKTLLIVPQKKLESIYEQFENRRGLQSVRQWVMNTHFRLFELSADPVLSSSQRRGHCALQTILAQRAQPSCCLSPPHFLRRVVCSQPCLLSLRIISASVLS